MPITVFSVGVAMGTEKFSLPYAANMALVGVGVATASYGARLPLALAALGCSGCRGWSQRRSGARTTTTTTTCATPAAATPRRRAQL